jgi:hypothetical protein
MQNAKCKMQNISLSFIYLAFLTSALDDQLHAPAAFPQGKEPSVPMEVGSVGTQNLSE